MRITNIEILNSNSESASFITEIINNLDFELTSNNFRKRKNSTSIEFHRILKRTTNTGNNNRESLKLLRTGKIELKNCGQGKFTIRTSIKLDHLIFLTLISGLALFSVLWILNIQLFATIMISIIEMILIFLFGLFRMKEQINKIIEKAIKNAA